MSTTSIDLTCRCGARLTTIEHCEWSDLPVYECDHCPQEARQTARNALREANECSVDGGANEVIAMRENAILRVVPLWPEVAPGEERPNLRLYPKTKPGTCACGLPLTDNATGCPECIAEMERILGDTPWLVEQLDLAITGQRAKRAGAARSDDGLPWNNRASETLDALRNEMSTTIRMLAKGHGLNLPGSNDEKPDLGAMSRWLLTHIQLLAHDDAWADTLHNLRRIEGDTLAIVDNPPPKVFLGWCDATVWAGEGDTLRLEECSGPVYARDGVEVGYCRECRKPYGVTESREALEKALDDQLVTASEIAKLATYLGIEQPRERVRKLVESWRKRKRIEVRGSRDGVPTFRYGEVRPLLSMAYETRDDRSV